MPSSLVVIATESGSTAKWTSARRPSVTFLGSRSVRYCSIACSMFWPVRWFLSSAVATGMPLRNRQRSTRLVRLGVERQLPRDRQPVGVVVGDQLRRDAEGRLAIGEADLDVLIADAVADDVDGPALVDLLRQPLDEPATARAPRRRRGP